MNTKVVFFPRTVFEMRAATKFNRLFLIYLFTVNTSHCVFEHKLHARDTKNLAKDIVGDIEQNSVLTNIRPRRAAGSGKLNLKDTTPAVNPAEPRGDEGNRAPQRQSLTFAESVEPSFLREFMFLKKEKAWVSRTRLSGRLYIRDHQHRSKRKASIKLNTTPKPALHNDTVNHESASQISRSYPPVSSTAASQSHTSVKNKRKSLGSSEPATGSTTTEATTNKVTFVAIPAPRFSAGWSQDDQQTLSTVDYDSPKKVALSRLKNNEKKKSPIFTPTLKIILKSENFTIFYPGSNEDSLFIDSESMLFKGAAFSKMRTWFSFRLARDYGEAYVDSMSDVPEPYTLHCMVKGMSRDVIYTGWHRWGEDVPGKSTLICEPPAKYSDTDAVAVAVTNYHLRFKSEPSGVDTEDEVVSFRQTIGLEPIASGLHVCIAADSNSNVLLSPYYDIRIVNVVSSASAEIAPQIVTIYRGETRSSFIFKYCTGYFEPNESAHRYVAKDLSFAYLDVSDYQNNTFTVPFLQSRKWIRAEPLFENLKLTSPVILRCLFAFQISSNSSSAIRHINMYYRHETVREKRENIFTAVMGETLSLSCVEDTIDSSESVQPRFFNGPCSDKDSLYASGFKPSTKIRISKQMCIVCSSQLSQIALQISIEPDLGRNKLNSFNQDGQDNCPDFEEVYGQLFPVKYNHVCEQNAVSLWKGTQMYRTKTALFRPNTYTSFYTSRQFLVCQNHQVPSLSMDVHNQSPESSENSVVVKIVTCATGFVLVILILLTWKKMRGGVKTLREAHEREITTSCCRAKKDVGCFLDVNETFCEMDTVHPRENIARSRVSIAKIISSGKFSKVYEGFIKDSEKSDNIVDVTVKEYRRLDGKKAKHSFIRRINQEIQAMRVILPHFNVVRYYGFSLSPESILLIMELVKGVTLVEYLREKRSAVPGFVLKASFRSDISTGTALASSSSNSNDTVVIDMFASRQCSLVERDSSDETASDNFHDIMCCAARHGLGVASYRRFSSLHRGSVDEASDQRLESCNLESGSPRTEDRPVNSYATIGTYRSQKTCENLSAEVLSICRQVARGMAHIASLNIIHRKLESRNVLVQIQESPLVVKLCDFSLAYRLPEGEIIYKKRDSVSKSVRWMAPEAMTKGEFSVNSDVWSYGVLCWEVVTLGSTPFSDLNDPTAIAKAVANDHLPCPCSCDQEIFSVIRACFRTKPDERPSFSSLEETWSNILEMNSDYLNLKTDLTDEDSVTDSTGLSRIT